MNKAHRNFVAYGVLTASLALAGNANAEKSTESNLQMGENQLEEIVVVAQKRLENIQTTPIAVTAISNTTLQEQGIHDVQGLTLLVPNFEVSTDQPDMQIVIRGVASLNDAPTNDPAVAFNVDGVYLSRATGAGGTFFDLDHVEVLRGPQGTLYGRNADAGVVNVVPREPTGKYEAEGAIESGAYALFSTFGMFNVPIDDRVRLRIAFASIKHSGYISGGFDDADNNAGRVQLLVNPTDSLKVRFYIDYFHQGGVGGVDIAAPFLVPSNHWANTVGLLAQTPAGMANLLLPYPPFTGKTDDTVVNIHTQVDWSLGFATLTYIPAYVDTSVHWGPVYGSGTATPNLVRISNQITQELRLASDSDARTAGSLRWTGGLYWFHENQSDVLSPEFGNPVNPALAPGLLNLDTEIYTVSYAGFGQVTYSLLDNFRLTGGIRYTMDDKKMHGTTQTVIPGLAPFPTLPYAGSRVWHNFGWRAGAEWDVRDNSMAYVTVATGYKAGGFKEAPGNNTYNPETLTDYEIGIKNRFFSQRLQINLGGFYYKYKNYQAYDVIGGLNEEFSVGPSKLYGLELEGNYLVTDNDRIDLSVSFEHGTFGAFIFPLTGLDLSGYTFPLLATWTSTLGFQHTWRLGSPGVITAHIQSHYSSSYPTTLDQLPGSRQGAYTSTEINATYMPPSGRWSLQAYVKNLENKAVFTAGADSSAGPGLTVVTENPSDPRVFGVRVNVKFQ
jgi:iron complex outermembrane receptor protein